MGGWQVCPVREGTLSCGLPGSIHIDDQPVLSLTIPDATWRGAKRRSCHQIFLKERSKGLYGRRIKGGEKTAER